MDKLIPFNKPYITGREFSYITDAAERGQLSGDGHFTKKATQELERYYDGSSVLITHSCTAALEMCALLLNIQPGDEVVCPSYTFVSTANAFALRGARLVFVDIDPATLCIDINQAEQAITNKTKAIITVHYAGVSCDMDILKDICLNNSVSLLEDAAQAYGSFYKETKLGQFGILATLSFHETKNIVAGEGGCLIVNDQRFKHRAEVIREKGTDRSSFMRGYVDKYTWQDLGSSFLPGDLTSAFLLAQLEKSGYITEQRLSKWMQYYALLKPFQDFQWFTLPVIPEYAVHNAHMFYLLCSDNEARNGLLDHLRNSNIHATFHYIPLHSSPAGQKYGSTLGAMHVTDRIASTIIRLPLYPDLMLNEIEFICSSVVTFFKNLSIIV